MLSALFPLISSAQLQNAGNLIGLERMIVGLVNSLYPVLVAFAFAGFLWGIVTTIASAGNEKKKEEGKKIIFYSIISLFVIVFIFGILRVIQKTLFG